MGYVLFRVANGRCFWRISRILWRISRISSGNANFRGGNEDFRLANTRFHEANARFPKENGDFFLASAHFQPEKVDFQMENGNFSEANDRFRTENGLRTSERGRGSAGNGDWDGGRAGWAGRFNDVAVRFAECSQRVSKCFCFDLVVKQQVRAFHDSGEESTLNPDFSMATCQFGRAIRETNRLLRKDMRSDISGAVNSGQDNFCWSIISNISGPCRQTDADIVMGEYLSGASVKSGAPVCLRRCSWQRMQFFV
jgi:hypothetical protein